MISILIVFNFLIVFNINAIAILIAFSDWLKFVYFYMVELQEAENPIFAIIDTL